MRQTAKLITAILREAAADDALQSLIDELKNVLSRTWDRARRDATIEILRNLDRLSGPVSQEELNHLESIISQRLGTDYPSLVRQPVVDISEAVYGLGLRQAAAGLEAPMGVGIGWNFPDVQALETLNRNTLFWVGDYYNSQVQEQFREVLQGFYRGGYTRDQIARMLEETFAEMGPKTSAYWDLLADHTCTKIRELGRLSGYEQAGVEYLEVRAWLDSRTTAICRSLHGRIIAIREVRTFVDNFLRACDSGNPDAVKQAWPMWSEKQFRSAGIAGLPSGKLTASGVGLPPYHFRCRTITVAHFRVIDDQGRNVVNQGQQVTFWDGARERRETIAWEQEDRLGRNVTVTQDLLKRLAQMRPPVTPQEIIDGLKNLTRTGENRQPGAEGEMVCAARNGLLLNHRGNVLVSAYRPDRPVQSHFRDAVRPGTAMRVKSRWPLRLPL